MVTDVASTTTNDYAAASQVEHTPQSQVVVGEIKYIESAFAGHVTVVAGTPPSSGPPAWKLILLREGYLEQAADAQGFAEASIPAAVEAGAWLYEG